MAIKEKSERSVQKQVIDISGPGGNAFCILGEAKGLSKQLGLDWDKVHNEMTSGGYEHLLKTFDKHFGDFVDLQR